MGGGNQKANPPTIFEQMAKQSRQRLNVDGKPRGLLAHEDYGKGRNSLIDKNALTAKIMEPMDLSKVKTQRNSQSVLVSEKPMEHDPEGGRYATQKKLRKLQQPLPTLKQHPRSQSIVDVHYNREL